jgi:DNA-binding NarL/FixJ family response regulator
MHSRGDRFRVLLVDASDIVHFGFRALLTPHAWVEEFVSAYDASDACAVAERIRPHVAVIDACVGLEPGLDICAAVRGRSPETRVLVLFDGQDVSASAARAAGACGLVPKRLTTRELAHAVREVASGRTLFRAADTAGHGLSEREREVLRELASGARDREIAEHLCLSVHTVKDYARVIYRKMGARNRTDAVVRAARLGLLDDGRSPAARGTPRESVPTG